MSTVSVVGRSGSCSDTYVTQLFGVDAGLNQNWRIHHLCKFHCVWMLTVFFLQTKCQKNWILAQTIDTKSNMSVFCEPAPLTSLQS